VTSVEADTPVTVFRTDIRTIFDPDAFRIRAFERSSLLGVRTEPVVYPLSQTNLPAFGAFSGRLFRAEVTESGVEVLISHYSPDLPAPSCATASLSLPMELDTALEVTNATDKLTNSISPPNKLTDFK